MKRSKHSGIEYALLLLLLLLLLVVIGQSNMQKLLASAPFAAPSTSCPPSALADTAPLQAAFSASASFSAPGLFDTSAASSPQAYTIDPSQPGNSIGPASQLADHFGINIHTFNDGRIMNGVQSAGAGWIRDDIFWSDIERTKGVYSFSQYDALLRQLQQYQMHALFILDYGNPLYDKGNPPTSPAAIAAFGNFAAAVARHFACQGIIYEIWNEPDNPIFWPPAPNAARYAALETLASQQIHAADPSALVSSGGVGDDPAFLTAYLRAGGGKHVDAIAIHPYTQQKPETVIDALAGMQQVLHRYLKSPPPIWITEWGYPSSPVWYNPVPANNVRSYQAEMAVREVLTSWSLGVPFFVYYDIQDSGTASDGTNMMGLLDTNFAAKPAMNALQTLAYYCANRHLVAIIPTPLDGLHVLKVQGLTDTLLILWDDHEGASVDITFTRPPLTIADYGNVALPFAVSSPSVMVGNTPVYAVFPA
jgi:hypothetical protein